MKNKNICIAGASGFIGSKLFDRVKEYEYVDITTIDIQPLEKSERHIIVDIKNGNNFVESVNKPNFDCIINLAAAHRDDIKPVSIYHEVNVDGARHICELAEANRTKQIIFTSSVAVYGFAPPDTGEDGEINPFNEYGRTKAEAEVIYREWQCRDPENRSLVIIRPTVVFGPGNRGNVYNLFRQISSGVFIMIGNGHNKKSMAYVDNVVAFVDHSRSFGPGVHVFNYVDKPDFNMNELVTLVRTTMGKSTKRLPRFPKFMGLIIGKIADGAASILHRPLPISSIRVEKFCATTQFSTKVGQVGFEPPVDLREAVINTIQREFLDPNTRAISD